MSNAVIPASAKVEVKKLAPQLNPIAKTPTWEDYMSGDRSGSLPIEYTAKGTLLTDCKVGGRLDMARTERNGVMCDGHFLLSKIEGVWQVSPGFFEVATLNSIYKVLVLE